MPPAPCRAARGSGMAPEAPGAGTRHAGAATCWAAGNGRRETPGVRRGQQPGGSSSSSSREKLAPLGEPSASSSSVGGSEGRAGRRWEREEPLGRALPALPARGSSRNPAGKAGAPLGRAGTVPAPAPARAGAPRHGPSSVPVPAPRRSHPESRRDPRLPPPGFLGGSLPRGPVRHALGRVGVGMWPAKPRNGPSQEFPSQ